MLNAGIVDEYVNRTEIPFRLFDQPADFVRLCHIRADIDHLGSEFAGKTLPDPLDLLGIAETVQRDIRTRAASARAIASPIPDVEPVTMALRPES
jgi:hypothetical protein